jgi:prefoldin subunit 5
MGDLWARIQEIERRLEFLLRDLRELRERNRQLLQEIRQLRSQR